MPGSRPHLTATPPWYHCIPPTDTHFTGNQGSCLPSTLPWQLAGTGRSEWPVFPGSGRAHSEGGARRLRLATASRTLLASWSCRSRRPSWSPPDGNCFQIDWKTVHSGPDSLFSSFQWSRWNKRSDQIRAILYVLVINQHCHDIGQTTVFSFKSHCHISLSSQLQQCENLNIAALTHKWHLSHD